MALIDKWIEAKRLLDTAKASELALRNEVIAAFSSEGPMAAGVENCPTFGGVLKITHKLDYKLADNDKVDDMLDKLQASIVGGNILADRLIKWEPSIYVSEYKKLDAPQKIIVDRVLTIKPATKSIEFKPSGA